MIRSGIGSPSRRIDLAAASDDAPTKTRNRRQRARQMSLIGSRVAYVNIAEDVGGHGGPNLEEGARNGGFWLI
jgi:hypothetical protein